MYASFFGLKREPFSIAPDPRYLFMSERHREALAHLLYGVGGGGGFVLLTGEIGAGKTTVCRCFLEQIPRRCNVAYIFNPKLTVLELLQSVCQEFRIPCEDLDPAQATVKAYLDRLNEFLLRTHAVGQNNVLIIDEAQNLSSDVLEQLRLLTNLETSERKLLQIILIGQPELREMLARPELEQLAQRVIARFHLEALSEAETGQYIAHRLGVAGLKAGTLFDAAAVRRIHQVTRGVPRRINLLCDRALLGAYATGKPVVSEDIVVQAAREVFELQPGKLLGPATRAHRSPGKWLGFPKRLRLPGWPWLAAGTACAVAIGIGAWGSFQHSQAQPPQGSVAAPQPLASAASSATTTSSSPLVETAASNPGTTAASGAAAGLRASTPTPFDWSAGFAPALRQEKDAWRLLGQQWGLVTEGDDPCVQAAKQQLACFRSNSGLGLVQLLDRPAVLTLFDQEGKPAYGLLVGLSAQQAQVQIGDQTHRLSLAELSRMWRGDFGTLWQTPEGYKGKLSDGQSGPVVEWLAQQLAVIQHEPPPVGKQKLDPQLKARLHAFQLTQGLQPDGVAGPTTFMQLNRALGVAEPQLQGPHVVHP
ncbi:AAA family ATPase [Aquabacterium sp.]|uniref:AAA family ATPase n=1 Tax=Aquabacterium sp. TaxID=1872578 RepID=UPI002E37B12E|nr:AAA family ATPase [Aquabacterium sp.]HEX5310562.1 AAA family ATPase [Aquabacterium sp.]